MDRREEQRFPVFSPGKVIQFGEPGRDLACSTAGISATALKLEVGCALPVGDIIGVEFQQHLAIAEVRYCQLEDGKFWIGAERIHAAPLSDLPAFPVEKTVAPEGRFGATKTSLRAFQLAAVVADFEHPLRPEVTGRESPWPVSIGTKLRAAARKLEPFLRAVPADRAGRNPAEAASAPIGAASSPVDAADPVRPDPGRARQEPQPTVPRPASPSLSAHFKQNFRSRAQEAADDGVAVASGSSGRLRTGAVGSQIGRVSGAGASLGVEDLPPSARSDSPSGPSELAPNRKPSAPPASETPALPQPLPATTSPSKPPASGKLSRPASAPAAASDLPSAPVPEQTAPPDFSNWTPIQPAPWQAPSSLAAAARPRQPELPQSAEHLFREVRRNVTRAIPPGRAQVARPAAQTPALRANAVAKVVDPAPAGAILRPVSPASMPANPRQEPPAILPSTDHMARPLRTTRPLGSPHGKRAAGESNAPSKPPASAPPTTYGFKTGTLPAAQSGVASAAVLPAGKQESTAAQASGSNQSSGSNQFSGFKKFSGFKTPSDLKTPAAVQAPATGVRTQAARPIVREAEPAPTSSPDSALPGPPPAPLSGAKAGEKEAAKEQIPVAYVAVRQSARPLPAQPPVSSEAAMEPLPALAATIPNPTPETATPAASPVAVASGSAVPVEVTSDADEIRQTAKRNEVEPPEEPEDPATTEQPARWRLRVPSWVLPTCVVVAVLEVLLWFFYLAGGTEPQSGRQELAAPRRFALPTQSAQTSLPDTLPSALETVGSSRVIRARVMENESAKLQSATEPAPLPMAETGGQ